MGAQRDRSVSSSATLASSTSNVFKQTVNPASTRTVISAAPSPATHGQPVKLTATVVPTSGTRERGVKARSQIRGERGGGSQVGYERRIVSIVDRCVARSTFGGRISFAP